MSKIDPILIDIPLPILTPRLRIEPVGRASSAAMIDCLTESKNELGQWMTWINKPDALTIDAREKWIRESAASYIERKTPYMAAYEQSTGRLVAGTGYHNIDWDIPSFEIGYWVRTSATGQGYATEITTALAHYSFRCLGARRVAICHADGNDASRRVIEKSGIPLEGVLKNHHLHVDGRIGDTYMYAATDMSQFSKMDIRWGNLAK